MYHFNQARIGFEFLDTSFHLNFSDRLSILQKCRRVHTDVLVCIYLTGLFVDFQPGVTLLTLCWISAMLSVTASKLGTDPKIIPDIAV